MKVFVKKFFQFENLFYHQNHLVNYGSFEIFDLTDGKDDLSRLFSAAVLDINDFFRNPKVSKQEKTIRSQGWIENGKKLIVRFTLITLKSRATGKETTKIDWEIRLPAKVDKKK